ncbi:hypothetical protein L798_05646 [Zootermopsis nevadensis]|uniref:Uncharacterized protein n=1 Tax=Zootermopsis nevadensis TaxID=136037 RepID=A0A067R9E0_ZOONE|nr:hypothetical protein L798_05646 [Zootermopsis nevadensis]
MKCNRTASPDLAPCDFFLFPKLKAPLKDCYFDDVNTIQRAVMRVLNRIPDTAIRHSFQLLHDRRVQCVDAGGSYFE